MACGGGRGGDEEGEMVEMGEGGRRAEHAARELYAAREQAWRWAQPAMGEGRQPQLHRTEGQTAARVQLRMRMRAAADASGRASAGLERCKLSRLALVGPSPLSRARRRCLRGQAQAKGALRRAVTDRVARGAVGWLTWWSPPGESDVFPQPLVELRCPLCMRHRHSIQAWPCVAI